MTQKLNSSDNVQFRPHVPNLIEIRQVIWEIKHMRTSGGTERHDLTASQEQESITFVTA